MATAEIPGCETSIHRYLDTHMGFDWLPEVRDWIDSFCAQHQIIFGDAECFPKFQFAASTDDSSESSAIAWIGAARFVNRPQVSIGLPACHDSTSDLFAAGVAEKRGSEAKLLTDSHLLKQAETLGVQFFRYDEVLGN